MDKTKTLIIFSDKFTIAKTVDLTETKIFECEKIEINYADELISGDASAFSNYLKILKCNFQRIDEVIVVFAEPYCSQKTKKYFSQHIKVLAQMILSIHKACNENNLNISPNIRFDDYNEEL
ncbi:hypothetical protein [Anaerosinus sp.]|uniref:hypothetical protein n=1 Tax=Selenobaculum sp. TaxID=3074374 RepID=UPI003AB4074F